MLKLLSERSGPLQFTEIPGIEGVGNDRRNFQCDTGGKIGMQMISRPAFEAGLFNIRLNSEEKIVFSEIPHPYTIIFVFGYSITLYLSSSLKKEIHDRGAHLFYSRSASYEIRFQKDRNYLVISVQYATAFVRQNLEETAQAIRRLWEINAPIFYFSRARITDRETLELLSALLLPAAAEPGIMPDEIARVILTGFLQESNHSFQPAHLRAKHFETFYKERDDLTTQALKILPASKLLQQAGIRQVPQFRKKMNQLYHLNIREYITEIRMVCAMNLLKDPTLSIKEIAAMSGFKTAFYFSRVFTNYFGAAPKFFRPKN